MMSRLENTMLAPAAARDILKRVQAKVPSSSVISPEETERSC
jgi:hypothetical protein